MSGPKRFPVFLLLSLLVSSGWIALPGLFAESGPIPEALPIDRYARLIQHSPFAPATPQATEEPKASFADQLYVSGIAKLGDKDCVFVSTKDKKESYSLISGEPSTEGLQLESVEWSPEVGKTKVRVKKGGESGVLEFDQTAVAQVPASQMPNPAVNMAPTVPQQGGHPGVVQSQRGPGNSGAPGTPSGTRRRFRIISPNSQ